jgi:DNA invertase Pin-like site-specific DNA recombinase
MNGRFISYLRVSTQRQGKSGLGLAAQREAVTGFLNGGKWTLVAEFQEAESGKDNKRPELAKALALCRLHRATLLVAKIDRLARNVAFVSALMESGVKFQAVDMPEVSDMVVHILASVAQGEAKAISDRTKAALTAAKDRGQKLGGLRWNSSDIASQGQMASLKVRREKAEKYRADMLPIIEEKMRIIEAETKLPATLRQIADALNEEKPEPVPAPRGGEWSPVQVSRILKAA